MVEIKPYSIEKGQIISLIVDDMVLKTWPIQAEKWSEVAETIQNHINISLEYVETKNRYEASKANILEILKSPDIVDTAQMTIQRIRRKIGETQ